MSRMQFNSSGKLVSVDSVSTLDSFDVNSRIVEVEEQVQELKTSDSLGFLQEHNKEDSTKDSEFWSLYDKGRRLNPLRFSNGKT
ncbi:MAG TPA: hypothetical protein VHA12_01945, partial [Candidatus Nanoarchaeia archaeon]|nr:hypothetical protein [Candidatus Nanoarchaeia archaeon]